MRDELLEPSCAWKDVESAKMAVDVLAKRAIALREAINREGR
jgi:hypothetical protein